MRLTATIWVGFDALRSNRMRTLLSTLGVIIGVGALVSVLALGDAVEAFSRTQIAETTDLLAVTVRPRTTRTVDGVQLPRQEVVTFTAEDVAGAAAVVGPRARLDLFATSPTPIPVNGEVRAATVIGAVGRDGGDGITLRSGRFFESNEADAGARVAVVSEPLAAILPGDTVILAGTPWPVVGVVEPAEGLPPLRVYVPIGAVDGAVPPTARPVLRRLIARANDIEDVEPIADRLGTWARERWDEDAVVVTTNTARVRQASQAIVIFKLLMGAIAGISLVVGGIGIMNVLLAAVTERTREIGVRKAAGARNRDVLIQFLSESVVVSSLGCILGSALGYSVAHFAAYVMRRQTGAPVHPAFTWGTPAIAIAAAVIVGITFGLYPAFRAARLSVVEAIRHE